MSQSPPVLRHWSPLGTPGPRTLEDDRLQLHHAVQLLAAFGQAFVAARADDSHRSVQWDPGSRRFVSERSADGLRAALSPAEMTLHLVSEVDLSLRGRTLDEGRAWLAEAVADARGGALPSLEWPEFRIPDHPVGSGAPLSAGAAGLAELERWFGNAHAALSTIRSVEPRAGAIRCWPHHLDLATLVVVADAERHDDMRTVGMGLSPGDDSYAEPYWYVNPWPRPRPSELPALSGPGRWHTEGWVGAVLTASEVVGADDGSAQAGRVIRFLSSGLAAGLTLVER